MANKEMRKEAKSVSMWAASVAMAKELLMTPPTISAIMKSRHSPAATSSFRRALKVKGIFAPNLDATMSVFFLLYAACVKIPFIHSLSSGLVTM